MVSTKPKRPNHYELLGLKPSAGRDEILRAFAREIGRPRAFGGFAEVSIAFETLRDPVKRRAYDASLATKAAPALSYSVRDRAGGPSFIGARAVRPVERASHDRQPAPAAMAKVVPPGVPLPKGFAGMPVFPYRVKVVDPKGNELPRGRVGAR